MFVLGFSIAKPVNEWLSNLINGMLKWVIDILKSCVNLLNTNLKQIDTWYGIFLAFATSLIVVVVLSRILITLISEAEEGTDVTWATIVIDAVKSAAAIPIMVFFQGFIAKYITIPLITYAFNDAGGLSMKSVEHASKVATSHGSGYGYGVPLLILGFFLVVMVVFFFKIGIFFADLAFYNISIPLVGVSIATSSFDYFGTWWKSLVGINLTIVAQTVSLALMVATFGWLDKGWGYLAFTIGFGYMIINPPTVLKGLWQSTGMGKATARMGARQMASLLKRS